MSNNLFVRIQNNEVTDCWDFPPPAGQDGWKSAVEVRPPIIAHRQAYTTHRFDVTTDPVQIVYDTFDISVADRKVNMKDNAGFAFTQEMRRQAQNPASYNPATLTAIQATIAPKLAAIEAAASHDELDALL